MTEKKKGRPPSGAPAEPTRNIRMNDVRWHFFKSNLGTAWLRDRIDIEIARKKAEKEDF